MWKLIPVVVALPVIVAAGLVGGITCFISITVVSFAPTATDVAALTPAIANVNAALDVVVFVIKMLVTTVVTLVLGCVYKVVVEVAADVRAKVFDITAISYCFLSIKARHPL
jgi:hypothetical protein